ncbi:MAG: D-alanine--D-alanine ligase, partial [Alphaproteobacteria bacterium]|nr:D-alanine--D-alanine ligase [Alphaproteobacteria bacterium]
MIIKDIAKQEIPEIGNILPLKKKNIFPIRIDKTIEIVTVPKLANKKENQKNVGIVLEEKIILKILSKRY